MTEEQADGWASLFWTAFDQSANPMALIDGDRTVRAVNEAFTTVLGYSREAVVGHSVTELVSESNLSELNSDWQELRTTGRAAGEREIIRGDGHHETVEFAARSEVVTGHQLALFVMLIPDENSRSWGSRAHGSASLTPREREIVSEIAMGRRVLEIAHRLHIAPTTVKTHIRNAAAKLDARSQAQLVAIAMATGLLDPECVYR